MSGPLGRPQKGKADTGNANHEATGFKNPKELTDVKQSEATSTWSRNQSSGQEAAAGKVHDAAQAKYTYLINLEWLMNFSHTQNDFTRIQACVRNRFKRRYCLLRGRLQTLDK